MTLPAAPAAPLLDPPGGDHPATDRAFCAAALPRVSRTFALCIRLLPRGLGDTVRTAYLLCRVADTIEDAERLDLREKRGLLAHWRDCLADGSDAGPIRVAFDRPTSDDERLARGADVVLRELRRLVPAEQEAVVPWVREMCDGMAEFARSGGRPPGPLSTLERVADLDRYCYYVAGTVGHLLTGLFRLHAGPIPPERGDRLEALATSFGLGLQLTNIIKDVADDHRRGWSFIPRELCAEAGVRPEDLFQPGAEAASRRVMDRLIAQAATRLESALAYAVALPRRAYRIRLFCLTSLFFAVRTLRLARTDPRLLDPGHKLKISRAQVYRTLAVTALVAPSNLLVRAYCRWLVGRPSPA